MSLPPVNLAAVVAGTALSFVSGFAWFGPKTFYPTWWRLMGRGANEAPGGRTPMPIAFGSVIVGQFLHAHVADDAFGAVQQEIADGDRREDGAKRFHARQNTLPIGHSVRLS